jgi:hypothetical protein
MAKDDPMLLTATVPPAGIPTRLGATSKTPRTSSWTVLWRKSGGVTHFARCQVCWSAIGVLVASTTVSALSPFLEEDQCCVAYWRAQ